MMGNNENEDLAWLIVSCFGALVVMRIWQTRVKPWLEATVPQLRDEAEKSVGGLHVATSDLVVTGVALVAFVLALRLIRGGKAAKKKAKSKATEPSS